MNHPIDELNRFLDDDFPTPANIEQRATAQIVGLLSTAPEPDAAFLGGLECRLASQPIANVHRLHLLPGRLEHPEAPAFRQRRAPGFVAAALFVFILLGASIGGLIVIRPENRPSSAFLPAARSSPETELGSTEVEATSQTDVYSGPGDQNTLIMAVAAGVVFDTQGSQTVNGGGWLNVRIKGTTISGWARSLGLRSVQGMPQSASTTSLTSTPKSSAASAVGQGGDASMFAAGDITWVNERTIVWTQPASTVRSDWQALPQDQLMVTGASTTKDGATWIPVENWALGSAGWVVASSLAPVDASSWMKWEPKSNRQVVTSRPGATLSRATDGSGDLVTTLEPGTTLIVTDAANQQGRLWLKLEIPGTIVAGWCDSSDTAAASLAERAHALTIVDLSKSFSPFDPNASAVIAQPTRVWSQPGTAMSVVATAKLQDALTITGYPLQFNDRIWVSVRFDATGVTGWVLSAYLNPLAASIPSDAALSAINVTTLEGSILYEKPTDQSTALVAFDPGVEMSIESSVTIHGVLWYQVSVPGTSIVGWAKWLQSDVLGLMPTPAAVPVVNQRMKPLHSGDLVQTHGTVGIWSKPGATMTALGTVAPGVTLKVTGSSNNQFGVDWIAVQESATGQSVWIAAGFLFPLPSDSAATPGSSPADGLTPTVTPVSTPIVAMTPNVVMSERPYLAELHASVGATVIQEIRIWSRPGPDMNVVWTAELSDHVTVTGEPISYNNADWAPIRNDATGQEGWILAYFLTPDNLPPSTRG